MALNYTFTMIKPAAFKNNLTGSILKEINEHGFKIRAMKLTKLSKKQAKQFYHIHKGKPFYENLIQFMSSGPVLVAILEKKDAVTEYRKLIGSTDPSQADEGTIRKMFAESKSHNAVHGSDSDENAKLEADFFFSRFERY